MLVWSWFAFLSISRPGTLEQSWAQQSQLADIVHFPYTVRCRWCQVCPTRCILHILHILRPWKSSYLIGWVCQYSQIQKSRVLGGLPYPKKLMKGPSWSRQQLRIVEFFKIIAIVLTSGNPVITLSDPRGILKTATALCRTSQSSHKSRIGQV